MKRIIGAFAALLAALFALASCSARRISPPENVSVWLRESGEIAVMPYSEYITGRVLAQLSPKAEQEALAAAACAANSAALAELAARNGFRNNGADFSDELPVLCGEELEQAFCGSQRLINRVSEAVEKGAGYALAVNGEPVCAPMCAVSSGQTEDVSALMPWVEALPCPLDKGAEGYESSAALTADMVCRALKKIAPEAVLHGSGAEWFSGAEYTNAGTLSSIDFGGAALDGAELRAALGLRSACISVTYAEDRFLFKCRGLGSNTGMSLYTANRMALGGADMEEILAHFYPEAELTRCG